MKQQDKISAQAEIREANFWNTIAGFRDSLNVQTKQSQEFHEEMKKAFGYNRDEHKQIADALGRINGYKKE